MDHGSEEYRPFTGPCFRLGGQLTQPIERQRTPVIDGSPERAQTSRTSVEDAQKLENMQKVAASWLEIIPAHPYTAAILASIDNLVVDFARILSAVDSTHVPEQIAAAAQLYSELSKQVAPFLDTKGGGESSDDGTPPEANGKRSSSSKGASASSRAKRPRV